MEWRKAASQIKIIGDCLGFNKYCL